MKHLSANRKNIKPIAKQSGASFAPEIFADSLEVMESYCQQKIVLLRSSLEKLNVADNAREIIALCQQIKKERNNLAGIRGRKG